MTKLLTFIALCASLTAFAQPGKGKLLVSGNISFDYRKDQFSASPYLGYFVSPKVAVGVVADYSGYKSGIGNIVDAKYTSFNAGPFVRYYHPITENFFFFAQADLTFGGYKNNYKQFDQINGTVIEVEEKVSATTFSVRPGISYFITKRWAVELIFGYLSYSAAENKGNYVSNTGDPGGFSGGIITRGVSPGIVLTF